MSTELIVMLSVLGFAGLIGLFYISHSIEKQRRQRALMIANLSDFVFRMQHLLDSIPAPYLGKDIQLLLLTQVKKRLEKLKELAPGNEKFRKKLESINAQIAEASNSTQEQNKPQLTTPEQSNELRKLLQALSKIIENFSQNKTISADEARKHLVFIQSSFIEANINYLVQMAESTRKENKPKVAILNYEKAIAEMQKRNQKGAFSARIDQIKGIIEELKVEAGHVVTDVQSEDNNELNQAMNEILEEEDAWKKKYF